MVKRGAVRDHIGEARKATFEVARGTDTETVDAAPNSVYFGRCDVGPLVNLNYSKYHSGLPPWQRLVSFTVEGDGVAEFGMPEYRGTLITGDLKTIQICSPSVSLS